jgi:murein DD-endopeptidase MepM/ murein hydrolase activator NlpD
VLRALNGSGADILRPGQKFFLPPGANPSPAAAAARSEQKPPPPAPPGWTANYTLKPGDSLYAIARRRGVKLAELERVNGITDSRRVRPGKVLRVPGAQTAAAQPAAKPLPPAAAQPKSAPRVTVLNPGDTPPIAAKSAEVAPAAAPAAATPLPPAANARDTRLRWPVRGKVVKEYGKQTDGTHNDGLNIAAPLGTEVHAAESGVVAYAGSELASYGRLVLIRHENGWITAYAHNNELLVKRGDAVRRGQIIAKAGNSGIADQPQVHFELRQSSKPVDPAPFMDTM